MTLSRAQAKLREADKKYRNQSGSTRLCCAPHESLRRWPRQQNDADGQSARAAGEIEERRATEIELGKLIEEIDIARQSRETFLSILTQQLEAPLKGALGMLEIIASRPLDRTQKDLLTLAVTSVETMQALLRSAESISESYRDNELGDETLRQMLSAKATKD